MKDVRRFLIILFIVANTGLFAWALARCGWRAELHMGKRQYLLHLQTAPIGNPPSVTYDGFAAIFDDLPAAQPTGSTITVEHEVTDTVGFIILGYCVISLTISLLSSGDPNPGRLLVGIRYSALVAHALVISYAVLFVATYR